MRAAALLLAALAGAAAAQDLRRSGLDFMTPALQALQRDDTQNPAWLWLKQGEQRFAADCVRCHAEDSARPMRGVAARHPAWDATLARPLTLGERIDQCRVKHVKAAPWGAESEARLATEIFVGHQSRGLPLAPPADPRLAPWLERGRALYHRRMGQLDFACSECHDGAAGGRLGGSTIPQAHPTAYPIYRLEWQTVGSLQRRLRNCMTGVRAEPWPYDAPEHVALELYLVQRAAGMGVETPGVRP